MTVSQTARYSYFGGAGCWAFTVPENGNNSKKIMVLILFMVNYYTKLLFFLIFYNIIHIILYICKNLLNNGIGNYVLFYSDAVIEQKKQTINYIKFILL